jgi:endonuclease YncB( thermonuclease family)
VRSFLVFCLLVVQVPFAWAWQGVVDQVIDGDSLKIRHESGRIYDVRLYGVDVPELAQTNGPEARDAAKKLVGGKSVNVQVINVDPNGTAVAVVYVNDQYSLQAFLVGSGWAWVYDGHCGLKICTRWQLMETQAKAANRGLWIDSHPVSPWKWRQQRYATGKATSVKQATVKKRKTAKRRKTGKKAPADISAELQTGQ